MCIRSYILDTTRRPEDGQVENFHNRHYEILVKNLILTLILIPNFDTYII